MIGRRRLVLAGLYAGPLAHASLAGSDSPLHRRAVGNPFTLGIAAGDPTATGATLWTRLAPDPLGDGGMPNRPVELVCDISRRADFSSDMRSVSLTARPETGHVARFRPEGLSPATRYHYRFRVGRFESRPGTFRTLPAEDDERPIRFGVVSCNRYEDGWFHAFRHLHRDDVDFVFHAGDYIYEKASKPGRPRAHGLDACISLLDYRRRYALYRLDPDLQALHAATAFIGTWDDHEVAGNWAGVHPKDGSAQELFALRRAAAFQAYWEAMPFDIPMPRPGGELRLFRSFQCGANARLVVLDTRQYRDDQACGDGTKHLCEEARGPTRTLLGPSQLKWLRRELTASKSAWQLIGQQVPACSLDLDPGAGRVVSMDKWDGYPAAQRRLDQALAGAPGVPVTLAGDAHTHFAAQRRDPADASPRGLDLVATSVTSGGDGAKTDPRWPLLKASNPDLLWHSRQRGYVLMTVTPESLRADFLALDRVSSRSHELRRAARARVNSAGVVSVDPQEVLLQETD